MVFQAKTDRHDLELGRGLGGLKSCPHCTLKKYTASSHYSALQSIGESKYRLDI